MLADLLRRRRAAVLKRWFGRIVETYPADAARVFSRVKDPFQNPVGQTIVRAIERLYDHLLDGRDIKNATPALEDLIRVRAVQDFSPSQALGFLFLLKGILRDVLRAEDREVATCAEWPALESRIDALALLGFDVYMQCRETLFGIRVSEVKRALGLGPEVRSAAGRPPADGAPRANACDRCNPTGGDGS